MSKKDNGVKKLVISKYSFINNPYRPEEYDISRVKLGPIPVPEDTVGEYRQMKLQQQNQKYLGYGFEPLSPAQQKVEEKKRKFNEHVKKYNQQNIKKQKFLQKMQDQNKFNIKKIQLKELDMQIRLKNIANLKNNHSVAQTERSKITQSDFDMVMQSNDFF